MRFHIIPIPSIFLYKLFKTLCASFFFPMEVQKAKPNLLTKYKERSKLQSLQVAKRTAVPGMDTAVIVVNV